MRRFQRNEISSVIAVCLLLVLGSGVARAQSSGFGIRAGASVSPNQFLLGGHIQSNPILPRLVFRPNIEVGVGSGLTTVAINVEFAYFIPFRGQPFDLYIGTGPALNVYSGRGDSSVDGGFNFLMGIQHKKGIFGEIKFGAIDSPDFKLTVGYSFR